MSTFQALTLMIALLNFDYRIGQISLQNLLQNLPGKMKLGEFWCNFDNAKRLHHKDLTLGEAPLIAQIGNTRFERATPTSRT